jgi:hypothetical protein
LELNRIELKQELPNSIYQKLRSFKFDSINFIDLSKFEKLQILWVKISLKEIKNVIPFLASKFSRDLFKKMQINLFLTIGDKLNIRDDENFENYLNILPKNI